MIFTKNPNDIYRIKHEKLNVDHIQIKKTGKTLPAEYADGMGVRSVRLIDCPFGIPVSND